MGCWRSVPATELYVDAGEPQRPRPVGFETAGVSRASPRLPWTNEATKWRWLLRTCQSLVASVLYAAGMMLRVPNQPTHLQLMLGTFLTLPFMLIYHWLSMNQSGGYYDTFQDMFVKLLEHLHTVLERGTSSKYPVEINYEHRSGIVRTVNALESGVIFMFVSSMSLGIAAGLFETCDNSDRASCPGSLTTGWLVIECLFFLGIHRTLGANVFQGKYRGFLMPEAMWEFKSTVDRIPGDPYGRVDCSIRPLRRHPEPTY